MISDDFRRKRAIENSLHDSHLPLDRVIVFGQFADVVDNQAQQAQQGFANLPIAAAVQLRPRDQELQIDAQFPEQGIGIAGRRIQKRIQGTAFLRTHPSRMIGLERLHQRAERLRLSPGVLALRRLLKIQGLVLQPSRQPFSAGSRRPASRAARLPREIPGGIGRERQQL